MRRYVLFALMSIAASGNAAAQATSRQCDAAPAVHEQPGPACILAHQPLGSFTGDAVYWRLYRYSDVAQAQRDRMASDTVVEAFGQVWLFTVGPLAAAHIDGNHVADVGPIPVNRQTVYAAAFLKSTFSPGMTAPVHVHSGPEAFYALSGDTCLETPEGIQVGRGPGNSIVVRGGPPMLLKAVGSEWRRGFALILHDAALPPTTLVQDWTPKNLCPAT